MPARIGRIPPLRSSASLGSDVFFRTQEDLDKKYVGELEKLGFRAFGGGVMAVSSLFAGIGADLSDWAIFGERNLDRTSAMFKSIGDVSYVRTRIKYEDLLNKSDACKLAWGKYEAANEAYEIKFGDDHKKGSIVGANNLKDTYRFDTVTEVSGAIQD
jgi:hypothetical protein